MSNDDIVRGSFVLFVILVMGSFLTMSLAGAYILVQLAVGL